MNKTIIIKAKPSTKKKDIDDDLLTLSPPLALNKLYLKIPFKGSKKAEQLLHRKLSSYGQQDKKKHRYNEKEMINYDQLLEKMVVSKMKCHYCLHEVLLYYISSREPLQWTLDRIDNSLGHNNNNVVIACLQCNLQRRRQDDKKFLFGKQMNIIKKY
jgi:hypothetical protein